MSRPWMPLYCADYLADTAHLTAAESGAYLHLIMHYWLKGGLPKDDAQLARIAKMKPREWAEARSTIVSFFKDDWRHDRIERELKDAAEAYDRRAKAGRKGGIAKAMLEQSSGNEVAGHKQSQPHSSIEETSSLRSDVTRASASPPSEPQKPRTSKPPRRHPNPVDAFERWYAEYPNKVGRAAAEKAFAKIQAQDDVAFEQLLAGLERYRRTKPADREWCNPSTWLNQGRWCDEAQAIRGRREACSAITRSTSAAAYAGPSPRCDPRSSAGIEIRAHGQLTISDRRRAIPPVAFPSTFCGEQRDPDMAPEPESFHI